MSDTDFRRKIKSPEELRSILGTRPRSRSVIMCHGTFDLVHPGHVRHLMYAKSMADILVASLTADAHVLKGNGRPFVPQELRAMNLAALESVDYVLIDDNSVPLTNLRDLQPDMFAKGYEYQNDGLHPRTAAEKAILESYGGRLVFTPDDIVYSSTRFLYQQQPNLAADKLAVLLEAEHIQFTDLRTALHSSRGIRVHVVGDSIVDSVTNCSFLGQQPNSPLLSVRPESRIDVLGGAALVAKHFRAAGAEVVFSTVLGNDTLKEMVLDDLAACGVRCNPVIDRNRPTTQKNVFTAGGHRLLKVDCVDSHPISDRALESLRDSLATHSVDAVIFSDFRHGIFNHRNIPLLVECLPAGALSVADSQVASRWGNILDFQGFDLITPNELEARCALADQDLPDRLLARKLFKEAHCQTLILKLGERGILTCHAANTKAKSIFVVNSFANTCVDPTGAGDALLAYATLSLVSSRSAVIASIIGSLAAAIICEREVNHPIVPQEILDKLSSLEQQVNYSCAL